MKKFVGAVIAGILLVIAIQYARIANLRPQQETAHPRVVSLAPSLTEIAFQLGAGDHIVGVTNYCVYPEEAQKREKVGDFVNPNIEKIVSLRPDLILAQKWTSSKIVEHLREMKLMVLETKSPSSLAEIYEVIEGLGQSLGRLDLARALIEKTKARVKAIEERGKRFSHRPSLYVEIDLPSWTAGRNSFINEAVVICGARNIFDDIERPAVQVSKEMVVARDPEVIVSFEAGISEIQERPGWNRIKAVRDGKMIKTPDRNLLSHGNHRLVEGMEDLQVNLERLMEGGKPGAGLRPRPE